MITLGFYHNENSFGDYDELQIDYLGLIYYYN
jgi:hypothetical protein